jgi:hypothetical protein
MENAPKSVQTTLGQSFHHEETKSTKKAACLGFLSFLRVLRFFVVCAIPVCPDLVSTGNSITQNCVLQAYFAATLCFAQAGMLKCRGIIKPIAMFNVINHLKSRDKHALAAFLGLALLCFLYFASGILVTYVSSPDQQPAAANKGFMVQVFGFQTHSAAEKLSAALRDRSLAVEIESDPVVQGYMIKVGPIATRTDAQNLVAELQQAEYKRVNLMELCPPGTPGCDPAGPGVAEKDKKK